MHPGQTPDKAGAGGDWGKWETILTLKSLALLEKSVLCSSRGKAETLPWN